MPSRILFNALQFTAFSGNLEGEREKRDVKALIDNPRLKFTGLYQR